jgi:hypothetical protein
MGSVVIDPALSFHEISATITQLERDKARLQEQLSMTETHLRAYKQLQQIMIQNPQGSSAQGRTSANAERPVAPTQSAGNYAPHQTAQAGPTSPRRVTGGSPSPTRAISPRRQYTPLTAPSPSASATLQTEQIYDELRQIRKAREEREAQRRAQMQTH